MEHHEAPITTHGLVEAEIAGTIGILVGYGRNAHQFRFTGHRHGETGYSKKQQVRNNNQRRTAKGPHGNAPCCGLRREYSNPPK